MAGVITFEDWLEDLHRYSAPTGRPAGDGWETLMEMARRARKHRNVIERFIAQSPPGYFEVARGTVNNARGAEQPATFYRRAANRSGLKRSK